MSHGSAMRTGCMKKAFFTLWQRFCPFARVGGSRAYLPRAWRTRRCNERARCACVHYQKHSARGCWCLRCRTWTLRFFTCTLRSAKQRVETITPGEVKFHTQVALQLTDRIIQGFEGCHELSRSALQTFELNQHRTAFACLFTHITGMTCSLRAIESERRRRSRIRHTITCLRPFHALANSKPWTHG
jgi:hypothetical protein